MQTPHHSVPVPHENADLNFGIDFNLALHNPLVAPHYPVHDMPTPSASSNAVNIATPPLGIVHTPVRKPARHAIVSPLTSPASSSSPTPSATPKSLPSATTGTSRSTPRRRSSHPCPRCGKMFTKRSNMAIHERLHTGEKPYACANGCGKKYKWLSSINFHMSRCTWRRPPTGPVPPGSSAPSSPMTPRQDQNPTTSLSSAALLSASGDAALQSSLPHLQLAPVAAPQMVVGGAGTSAQDRASGAAVASSAGSGSQLLSMSGALPVDPIERARLASQRRAALSRKRRAQSVAQRRAASHAASGNPKQNSVKKTRLPPQAGRQGTGISKGAAQRPSPRLVVKGGYMPPPVKHYDSSLSLPIADAPHVLHNNLQSQQLHFDEIVPRASFSAAPTPTHSPNSSRVGLPDVDRLSPHLAREPDRQTSATPMLTKATILEAVHTVIGELGLDHALVQAAAPAVPPQVMGSIVSMPLQAPVHQYMPKQHAQESYQQDMSRGCVQDRQPLFMEHPPRTNSMMPVVHGPSVISRSKVVSHEALSRSSMPLESQAVFDQGNFAEPQECAPSQPQLPCTGSLPESGGMFLPAAGQRNMFAMSQIRQPHGIPVSPMSPTSGPALKDDTLINDLCTSSGEIFPTAFPVSQPTEQFTLPGERVDRTMDGEEFELAASSVFGLGAELDF